MIIMFGHNDSRVFQYNEKLLLKDYASMIKTLKKGGSTLFVMIPPPLYKDGIYEMS